MEWISVEDQLPNMRAGKFRVRMKNDDETDAFFYEDGMGWVAFYGEKTGHWWSAHAGHKRLDDVTHWMPLSEKPKKEIENGKD